MQQSKNVCRTLRRSMSLLPVTVIAGKAVHLHCKLSISLKVLLCLDLNLKSVTILGLDLNLKSVTILGLDLNLNLQSFINAIYLFLHQQCCVYPP